MATTLSETLRRYTEEKSPQDGTFRTSTPGVTIVRASAAGETRYEIQRPVLCLVTQGAKEFTSGGLSREVDAGTAMVVAANIPTTTRIIKASSETPYLAFALDLDAAIISDLMAAMSDNGPATPVCTDREVRNAAQHLIALHDHPDALPILAGSIVREIHYWLLAGDLGGLVRPLGFSRGPASRIWRAVDVLRSRYRSALQVAELAEVAGMSPSTFHLHFKAMTSLTPIQFQKQLRLIEARHIMTAKGATAREAALTVGYESDSQFNRDYRRLFGCTPGRDTCRLREIARTGTKSSA